MQRGVKVTILRKVIHEMGLEVTTCKMDPPTAAN